MATLPYNPTVLLTSQKHPDIVYFLDDNDSTVQLRGLNISSPLDAGSLSFQDVTTSVPFGGDAATSYTAFMSLNGTIYALAGKCSDGANGAAAWTFIPQEDSMDGSWEQGVVNVDETGNTTVGGANYLAAGLAFSSNLNATADMYVFGGMCPDSNDEGIGVWQSDATYSNTLLHLQSEHVAGGSDYSLETVGSRGPPIPEAGFTITPLSPTYFNATTGNVTIQQNFVLLGGHTQSAFINMSQVAVLSLPEQSWAFIPIDGPSGGQGSDEIDPRSGHTAILSEDGTQIVLLGGWVGDVNTPADPQLAILDIGVGYGGDGDWRWTMPTTSGTGPAATGIYGHGAVMLPGNVLMVSGGVEIGSGQGELAKRGVPDAYFFNVSSKAWITAYTNPNSGGRAHSEPASDGRDVGLGAGLGVGLAALLALIIACIWFRRKKRNERRIHENDLRALALGNDQLRSPILGFGGIDGRGGDYSAGSWSGHPGEEGTNAYPWAPTLREPGASGQSRPTDAERTGLLVEIPSPTRGLRRSLHSRGNHWYDDGRRSRGSSYIHPIDERDEYEHGHQNVPTEMVQLTEAPVIPRPTSRPPSDPFRDPPEQRSLLDGSRSPSPQLLVQTADQTTAESAVMESAPAEDAQLGDWDAAAAAEVEHLAADKAERTSSSLSTHSMVSALSEQPASSVADSIGRTQSQRSAAVFSTGPLPPSTNPTTFSDVTDEGSPPAVLRMSSPSIFGTPSMIKRRPVPAPLGSHPSARRSVALQPGSSPSSFQQLQAEGPGLLRGSPQGAEYPMPGHVAAAVARINDDENDFDAEPLSRRKPSQTRPRSWMGSVKRALAVSASVASQSSRSSATPSPVGRSGGSSPRRREFQGTPMESSPSGGAHAATINDYLQRPPSSDQTGSSPWSRRQQGARAWTEDHTRSNTFTSDHGPIGDWGTPSVSTGDSEAEEEWDVEGAVERRVVQLMFTVPKEKLRVVNQGVGDADAASVKSQRSAKSAKSAKNGRRTGSGAGRRAAEPEDEKREEGPPAKNNPMLELGKEGAREDSDIPIRIPRGQALSEAIHAPNTSDGAEDENENYVIHAGTDDEGEGTIAEPHYAPSDDEDANFIVHAQTDDEGEKAEIELPDLGMESDHEDRESTPVPRALAWRKQRNAAVERLRQTSGEAAVERVRSGSGESARSAGIVN